MESLDRFYGCLLGLAAGDAVGTRVEFKPRGNFTPVTGMQGGGPFHLQPGQWTDDTSMALCLATSLVERAGFDARDQMERYWRWYRDGYLSSTREFFDIGSTTLEALQRYRQTGDPFAGSTDPQSAGNGSIMRLAPIPIYYFPDRESVLHYSVESSRTTHAAPQCLEACRLLGDVLFRALSGLPKRRVLLGSDPAGYAAPSMLRLISGEYMDSMESDIRGTGYVVESLEAALWCFWKTDSFEQAILKAANLGDDADTTAAVCGQIAGAFYGASGIPSAWLDMLYMRREIEELVSRLRQATADIK